MIYCDLYMIKGLIINVVKDVIGWNFEQSGYFK